MLNNVLGLGVVLWAKDLASKKIADLETRFSSLDERITGGANRIRSAFQHMDTGAKTLAISGGALAAGFKLAGTAGHFEQMLAGVNNITHATRKEMRALSDAAIDAGIRTQFSPIEAVEGLETLASKGLNAQQSISMLLPVLDLAAASLGKIGVAEAATAVGGTLNAFTLGADHATEVTDKLLRITELTAMQTEDFQLSLSEAASAGHQYRQSLDDVLVSVGLMRNLNYSASVSGTAYRETVRRLATEQTAQQAVTELGVSIFDRSTGQMRSSLDIISDFAEATSRLSEQERLRRVNQALGAEGMRMFAAVSEATTSVTRDGVDVTLRGVAAINEMRRSLGDAAGTASGMRDSLLQNFAGQKKLLGGTLETLGIVLGKPLEKTFGIVVGWVVDGLNNLLMAVRALPAPLLQGLSHLFVGAAGFLALASALKVAQIAFGLMSIAARVGVAGLGGLTLALGPAALMIGAAALALAGLRYAFAHNFGGIADKVQTATDKVGLFFAAVREFADEGAISESLFKRLQAPDSSGVLNAFMTPARLGHRLGLVWEGIASGFGEAMESAKPAWIFCVKAFGDLSNSLNRLFGTFTGSASKAPSSFFTNMGRSIGWVAGLFASAIAGALGILATLVTCVAEDFARATSWLQSIILTAVTGVSDIASALSQGFARGWEKATMFWQWLSATVRSIPTLFQQAFRAVGLFFEHMMQRIQGAVNWMGDILERFGVKGSTAHNIEIRHSTVRDPAAALTMQSPVQKQVLPPSANAPWSPRANRPIDSLLASPSADVAALGNMFRLARETARFPIPQEIAISYEPSLVMLDALKPPPPTPQQPENAATHQGKIEWSMPRVSPQNEPAMPPKAQPRYPAVSEIQERRRVDSSSDEAPRSTPTEQPLLVNLSLDGETLARAVFEANQRSATRRFAPLPAY